MPKKVPRKRATPLREDLSRPPRRKKGVTQRPPQIEQKKSVKKAAKKTKPRVNPSDVIHSAMTQAIARKKLDISSLSLTEASIPRVGIELPSLCLELFLSNQVLPLSQMYFIGGEEGTMKSGLIAEISRWFIDYGGGVSHIVENESKKSPDWFASIAGYDNPFLKLSETKSFDEAQVVLTTALKSIHKKMTEGAKAFGKTFPVALALDSIVGNATEKEKQKLSADGKVGRNFPLVPLLATFFLPAIMPELHGFPISMFVITHLNITKDETNPNIVLKRMKGGNEWMFRSSHVWTTRKAGGNKGILKSPKYEGRKIRLDAMKNSDATTDARHLVFDLKWADVLYQEKKTGRKFTRQKTVFDWDTATARMLSAPGSYGLPLRIQEAIKDVLPITYYEADNVVACDYFGLKKADGVNPRKFCKLLKSDPKKLKEFRLSTSIKEGMAMKAPADFDDLTKQSKETALARSDNSSFEMVRDVDFD